MAHYLSAELQSLLIGALREPLQQTTRPSQPPDSSITQNWSTGSRCAPEAGPPEPAALKIRRVERERVQNVANRFGRSYGGKTQVVEMGHRRVGA